MTTRSRMSDVLKARDIGRAKRGQSSVPYKPGPTGNYATDALLMEAAASEQHIRKLLVELAVAQKENIKPENLFGGMAEEQAAECQAKIDKITNEIKATIKQMQERVKAFAPSDRAGWGVQRSVATRWNTLHEDFRSGQMKFVEGLHKKRVKEKKIKTTASGVAAEKAQAFEEETRTANLLAQGFSKADIQSLMVQRTIAQETDREVTLMLQDLTEIHSMFEQMHELVMTQGSVLDAIDHNLGIAMASIKDGHKELKQASVEQKKCVIS